VTTFVQLRHTGELRVLASALVSTCGSDAVLVALDELLDEALDEVLDEDVVSLLADALSLFPDFAVADALAFFFADTSWPTPATAPAMTSERPETDGLTDADAEADADPEDAAVEVDTEADTDADADADPDADVLAEPSEAPADAAAGADGAGSPAAPTA
jgi:hypothetical protein